MTELKDLQNGVSSKWKRFQSSSLQIAAGSLSACLILFLDVVEKAFIKADLAAFHAIFIVVMIVIGVIAVFCSGGIGLLQTINAKRVLQLMEKEEKSNDGT